MGKLLTQHSAAFSRDTGDETAMDRLASTSAKSPEKLRTELLDLFTHFEEGFRKDYPLFWLMTLVGPIVLTAAILIGLGLFFGWDYSYSVVVHAFLTFFVFGRFIVLLGMPDAVQQAYEITMHAGELFALVTYMDVMVAMFVTFHMGFLFRFPYVGPKIAALVWDGKFIMAAHPWIRRMAFLGLVLFVMFPTSTTGSIGGSIFGRLLGLSRFLTVTGVLLGSLMGNALMYAFSKRIDRYIDPSNMWIKIAGGVILVGIFVLIEIRYQAVKKKYFKKDQTVE